MLRLFGLLLVPGLLLAFPTAAAAPSYCQPYQQPFVSGQVCDHWTYSHTCEPSCKSQAYAWRGASASGIVYPTSVGQWSYLDCRWSSPDHCEANWGVGVWTHFGARPVPVAVGSYGNYSQADDPTCRTVVTVAVASVPVDSPCDVHSLAYFLFPPHRSLRP